MCRLFLFGSLLNDSCLFQGLVCAVLLESSKTAGGDVDKNGLIKLWDEDAALLEVSLAAYLSGRVELGSTGTV